MWDDYQSNLRVLSSLPNRLEVTQHPTHLLELHLCTTTYLRNNLDEESNQQRRLTFGALIISKSDVVLDRHH